MKPNGFGYLIGDSEVMLELREEIARVASCDSKVLITGESGAGKELVARAIHGQSARSGGPLVAMNCAGLPETLLESELFGHVKGSFTGAYRDQPGKLELAHRGTIFLDEIGEMTLRMQALLLRFLETGELQKVGAARFARTVDSRVITATNRDLSRLIREGTFREDLFFRINVVHLVVPPLRARRSDIPLLVEHFLDQFGRKYINGSGNGAVNGHVRGIAPEAMEALMEYTWPGNVRELENVVERLLVRSRTEVASLDDLPPEIRQPRRVVPRPVAERRRTVADELYARMRENRESFWTVVHASYVEHEITRDTVRSVVRRGLEESRGNYRIVAELFNIDDDDYGRFLSFLRKHQCQLPFRAFRH